MHGRCTKANNILQKLRRNNASAQQQKSVNSLTIACFASASDMPSFIKLCIYDLESAVQVVCCVRVII